MRSPSCSTSHLDSYLRPCAAFKHVVDCSLSVSSLDCVDLLQVAEEGYK